MPAVDPLGSPRGSTLLAADRRVAAGSLAATADPPWRGAMVRRGPAGVVRRAEPGPAGPLVLEVQPSSDGLHLQVWGPAATPPAAAHAALAAAAAWVGLDDDPRPLADILAGHPALQRALRRLGAPRLGRLPRVGEAYGRAVLGQLVQSLEAIRSALQLALLAGEAAPHGLWCWPTAARLGALPSWSLRRCGISARAAVALQAGALADSRLEAAAAGAPQAADWAALDRRLRALPGVGVWTSAETRRALGDPDAVSVGDYHLPAVIGTALGEGPVDDAGMLELLAPFAGQRGRVVSLVLAGIRAGLLRGPRRRAPRAALSAHRYW